MCVHMCACERHRQWKSEFGKYCECLKKVLFYKLEKLRRRRTQLKKKVRWQIKSFILGLGRLLLCNILKTRNTKGGYSVSDSPFMHLYYKKCASSSKLAILSKVLQFQLGICLSGLALFTVLFLWPFLVCSSLGGHSGVFLCGGGFERGSFVSSILDFGE